MEVEGDKDDQHNSSNGQHYKTTPRTMTTPEGSAATNGGGDGDEHVVENGNSSGRQKADAGVGSGSKVFVSHSPEGSIAARVVNLSDRG